MTAAAHLRRPDGDASKRNIETARLGLCGAAIGFVRALDGHADPAELGHRLERLRSRATDYLMAVRPGDTP
jgi:hypothetical protein